MASSRNKPSIDANLFGRRVLARVQSHLRPTSEASICVAYSGGVDSTVLLDSLHRALASSAGGKLSAIHVHHGLSPNANNWASHCEKVCSHLGVPLQVVRVVVRPDRSEGIEAAARRVRYQVFASVDADLIVLGQHQDDQAETLLHNLLRGASVLGASSMPTRRGRFVRPLLDVSRQDILSYAELCGLSWIEDESNDCAAFTRNYLRKDVLPKLKDRFPAASENLARAASTFAEAQTLLDDLAVLDGADQVPLSLSVLSNKTEARARNVLAYHLRKAGIRIASRAWLANLLKQLLTAAPDRQVQIPCDGKVVRRYRGALVVDELHHAKPQRISWSAGEELMPWGAGCIRAVARKGQGVSIARLAQSLEFRTRQGSDVLEVRPGLRRSLKDLMRESRIPPWVRHQLPVLVSNGELVWVPFVGISEKYRCGAEEDGISLEFDEASW